MSANESTTNPYRQLPSVARVLTDLGDQYDDTIHHAYLTSIVQSTLDEARAAIQTGAVIDSAQIENQIKGHIKRLNRSRLEPVINATGILIHTNLGRAPVSPETAKSMALTAQNYVSLELEPETNQRGGRMDEIALLMQILTNAESTLVVNNNASAVLLTLAALASGREVIVSRGEAVEIGGGFRIPDVLQQSGATLVEIGTTNRTYARDYANAISPETAALLKVHPSNFHIGGFTASASIEEVVAAAHAHELPVIEDQGSGALVDVTQFGLASESTIAASLAAGANIVTASGDKLLGGPQAGIICGNRDLVAQISRHPLARSMRADKACLAGIATTLRHYLAGDELQQIPVLRMLAMSISELESRASAMVRTLKTRGAIVEIVATESSTGGGSLPGQNQPSRAIAIQATASHSADEIARTLRTASPGVFGRIDHDVVLLDLRAVLPEQDGQLLDAVIASGF